MSDVAADPLKRVGVILLYNGAPAVITDMHVEFHEERITVWAEGYLESSHVSLDSWLLAQQSKMGIPAWSPWMLRAVFSLGVLAGVLAGYALGRL